MSHILPVVVGLFAVFTGILPVTAAEKSISADEKGMETRASSSFTGVVINNDSEAVSRLLLSLSGPSGTSIAVSDDH